MKIKQVNQPRYNIKGLTEKQFLLLRMAVLRASRAKDPQSKDPQSDQQEYKNLYTNMLQVVED